jgi:hypothetical protein
MFQLVLGWTLTHLLLLLPREIFVPVHSTTLTHLFASINRTTTSHLGQVFSGGSTGYITGWVSLDNTKKQLTS